ncbi:hypothetical protein PENPOL_c009G03447 [Penicillium polonicum]|uniref:Uncharacterized protein n=1 Tax=Penicillium polonicum TaxID=60169 RepID=A0A1V6NFS7_PENPO|nr:hypothetical protein PENPOL_c009G03447 [Penicillium polonicum]
MGITDGQEAISTWIKGPISKVSGGVPKPNNAFSILPAIEYPKRESSMISDDLEDMGGDRNAIV